jgi:hypothetical protein
VVGEILHIFLTYQALPEDFLSNLDTPINLFLLVEGYPPTRKTTGFARG